MTSDDERPIDRPEPSEDDVLLPQDEDEASKIESTVRWKVDLRLCTIAGILCSLNLLDSGIISNASVTTMLEALDLEGNRYSVAILIFTVSSVCFQLPATLAVRVVGPRLFFSIITFGFGLVTLCTAFVRTWKEMILMRVLLGMLMSGIYPGLALLISTWYRREEQQLRFAYLQTGEVIVLASGGIANFGLNHLDGRNGLRGWQWMYIVQGTAAAAVGLLTYWWVVDFPDKADQSFRFLSAGESRLAVVRIQKDRRDAIPVPISLRVILRQFLDVKIYGFAILLFLLNFVSTALSYFLPIILKDGLGFSENKSILLSAPPYYYAALPALLSSRVGDKFRIRAPIIIFNALCLIAGIFMLGISNVTIVRYVGVYLATGAYVSNWAALNSYIGNNITGQWKRAVAAAVTSAFNGLGGVAGSFIFRQDEAPQYATAIRLSVGSHILLILIVCAFTMYFYRQNLLQKKGQRVIEQTPRFRYVY